MLAPLSRLLLDLHPALLLLLLLAAGPGRPVSANAGAGGRSLQLRRRRQLCGSSGGAGAPPTLPVPREDKASV